MNEKKNQTILYRVTFTNGIIDEINLKIKYVRKNANWKISTVY
jgi:hypothetical protein